MRKREFYILCTFVLIFMNAFSIKAEENHSEKAFNVKDVIFEHLTDSYSWELPFSHTHRLYLPVIVARKQISPVRLFYYQKRISHIICRNNHTKRFAMGCPLVQKTSVQSTPQRSSNGRGSNRYVIL